MTTGKSGAVFFAVALSTIVGGLVAAEDVADLNLPTRPVFVSEPVVPTVSIAVRDLPDFEPPRNLFDLEMKRREDFGFIPIEYPIVPRLDPLFETGQVRSLRQPDSFGAPIVNFAGQSSSSSPPDTNGDVGPNHYVQGINLSVSTIRVLNKTTGANVKTFAMQTLASGSPCSAGFCDSVVLYDRVADRWLITELPSSGGNVCVYVSTTPDPQGTWYYYTFAVESSLPDFPKYGVWPQNGNGGSYVMGANAGSGGVRDVFAFDRAKMLAGLPATFQKFSVAGLPNSGFELVLPSTMQGSTPPPNGEPAIFIRPRDIEAQGGATNLQIDSLELWKMTIDWATPANSSLVQLPSIDIADYDMTLCGLGGTWNCMPQPGTTQKIDPIREPLHFPLNYRNFGTHQSLVGTFPVDVDGTDHSALRWFELRKVGAGNWTLFQEGLVGGEANVHRSVGSIAQDQSGNIALAYTRTGTTAPYFPSMYYRGRLANDTAGTMPQGEYAIMDATTSKTANERWGDYSSMAVDPADDCTFWFTSQYGGPSGGLYQTRIASFKFDACGCLAVPPAPTASISVPQDNRLAVSWDDSSTASIIEYQVFRSTTPGGPYTQIATVPDSSPGAGGGAPYTYNDDTVSGGTHYYYQVKSFDGVSCYSLASNEVDAVATGQCLLAPSFAGVATVTNPGNATCSLNLSWGNGVSNCPSGVAYNVYRSTSSSFTPSLANRIATGVTLTSYTDAVGITGGTEYFYIVRAVDASNGSEESNVVRKSGIPTGPVTSSNLLDTFEGSQSGGGFDLAGWTKSALSGSTNWVWSTARAHDGTHSWFAQDVAGVNDKVLVSPSFGVGPSTTLSFWHTYAFEGSLANCYDGGTLEYSFDATTWTVLPAADFTSGGYTGTANAGFSNPIGGKRAWCSGTIGALTQVTANLAADANLQGRTIRLRWHEGDDTIVSSTGWYVDTVAVTNAQTGGTCSVGTGCTAPGAPLLTDAVGDCAGINLAWIAGTGSTTSYNVYRATTAGGPYTKLGGMPIVSTSYTDTTAVAGTTYYYVVTGACDAAGATESAYSGELNATRKVNGASCSDSNACTQTDTCQSGACIGGNPVVCTASDQCHDAGTCDTGTGVCSNPAKADGASCSGAISCTVGDACVSGVCTSGNPVTCTASDQCHDAGTCDTGTGVCSNPAKADGASCSDANSCTVGDACVSGVCTSGNPVTCTASDQCHDAGTCDTGTGVCSNPAKADGASCSDANSCTVGDACVSGACTSGNPVTCTASDECHDAGTCDTGTGVCSNPAKADGASCSDANSCTVGDACVSGVCTSGNPITCTASDQCHDAVCSPETGLCSNPAKADGAVCDDVNSCTIGDSCQSGSCESGAPVVCTASDQCHDVGACNPGTGACSDPSKADGAICSDGNDCTTADTCQSGACTPGTPVPAPGPTTELAFMDQSNLTWATPAGATSYDVVRGTLSTLVTSGFTAAVDTCVGSSVASPSLSHPHLPAQGDADWFLVRSINECGVGVYDEAVPSQAGPRDTAIQASAAACP